MTTDEKVSVLHDAFVDDGRLTLAVSASRETAVPNLLSEKLRLPRSLGAPDKGTPAAAPPPVTGPSSVGDHVADVSAVLFPFCDRLTASMEALSTAVASQGSRIDTALAMQAALLARLDADKRREERRREALSRRRREGSHSRAVLLDSEDDAPLSSIDKSRPWPRYVDEAGALTTGGVCDSAVDHHASLQA